MIYDNMVEGTFISRPNRFIAMVEIRGQLEKCHVKNTGRCRELLIPGTRVWLSENHDPRRKTAFSLITVEKKTESGTELVNLDSQAPNAVAAQWLAERKEELGIEAFASEKFYRESRFDFQIVWKDGCQGFLEVKGVTLEEDGVARFPDAPTERGVRHLEHLTAGQAEGLRNGVLFVIAMKGVRFLEPNDRTHRAFGDALRAAAAAGVRIMARDCIVGVDSLVIDQEIPIHL